MSIESAAARRVGLFLALTTLFSAPFWFAIAATGRLGAGHGLYITGLQWSPGLAGLVARYYYDHTLAGQGWKWASARLNVLSYLIPIVYITPVYVIAWLTGLGGFYDGSFLASEKAAFGWSTLPDPAALILYVLIVGTIGMAQSCATALGEEIGWRGFLVPELAKTTGFTNVALISGAAWAIWHFPLLLSGAYSVDTPKVFMVTCFTVTVLGLGFLFAWMRLASGSLWTGMLLHASHNLFVENIFDPLTTDTGMTRFVTGEFGIGLTIAAVVVGSICWRRRGELPVREFATTAQSTVPLAT